MLSRPTVRPTMRMPRKAASWGFLSALAQGDEGLGDSITRRDAMTGVTGSIVERKTSSPGSETSWKKSFLDQPGWSAQKLSAVARCKRYRPLKGSTYLPLKDDVVDRLDRNFTYPGLGSVVATTQIYSRERGLFKTPREIFRLDCGLEENKRRFFAGAYCRFGLYIRGRFQVVIDNGNPWSGFNKLAKLFGVVSKNKHFRYILKVITFCGMTKGDFKSLLRIRDLWMRGKTRAFYRSATNFAFCLPRNAKSLVEFSSMTREGRGRL